MIYSTYSAPLRGGFLLAQYPLEHEDYVELLPDAQTQHFNNNIPSVILEIDGSAFRQRRPSFHLTESNVICYLL